MYTLDGSYPVRVNLTVGDNRRLNIMATGHTDQCWTVSLNSYSWDDKMCEPVLKAQANSLSANPFEKSSFLKLPVVYDKEEDIDIVGGLEKEMTSALEGPPFEGAKITNLIPGFNNNMMSEADWVQKILEGCANCGDQNTPIERPGEVMWVNPNQYLCFDCGTDPDVNILNSGYSVH